jgi:alpha-1,3/alpha-1,6-mannosyltransferase
VIDAFSRFMRKSKRANYKLILAGSISKDREHVAYLKRLEKKNVPNVVFKLNVSDSEMKRLYASATAVLFAAVNEDFGIVPLEAMSSRKPIISVNDGGPKETIINGKTGFLVNSPEEMAEKMRFVVEHKDLAEKMGREGRRHVERNYSWGTFFKKFDRLARKVSKE